MHLMPGVISTKALAHGVADQIVVFQEATGASLGTGLLTSRATLTAGFPEMDKAAAAGVRRPQCRHTAIQGLHLDFVCTLKDAIRSRMKLLVLVRLMADAISTKALAHGVADHLVNLQDGTGVSLGTGLLTNRAAPTSSSLQEVEAVAQRQSQAVLCAET